MTDVKRPELVETLTGAEFLRWYWLKNELAVFARELNVRVSGSKEQLTQRIAAKLDGKTFTESPQTRRSNDAQLTGVLTHSTVIPAGQRCSAVVRNWFVQQVGGSFKFDAAMRVFFANSDGTQTMQDALDHYRTTRGLGTKRIDAQFEYNRFNRAWHQSNPAGKREDLLSAWQQYRERPVEERGRA